MAKKNCIIVGCDLHDKDMLLMVAHNAGKPSKKSYGTSGHAVEKMICRLKDIAHEAGGAEIHFAYEASVCGYGLYDELTDAGIHAYVFAPTLMERSVKTRKNKTDEKDARRVFQTLRGGLLAGNDLPEIWVPDHQTRDDREFLRMRKKVSDAIRGNKNKVQCLLKRHKIKKPTTVGKSGSQDYRKWLISLSESEDLLAPGARFALASLLRQIEALESELSLLDKAIAALAREPRYEPIVTELIKESGVGVYTAMMFLTEIGDLTRFSNRRQLAAYLGLVPSSNESGQKDDRKGHITRQGSSYVRSALSQAVWAGLRGTSPDKAFYERLVAKNPKHKKIAAVACMRRLAIRLWHIAVEALERSARSASPPSAPPRGERQPAPPV